MLTVDLEQHIRAGEAAAKTRQAAVAADHAMAWNDDRNGIAAMRQSDSAHGFGIADALRELQVGNSLSIRNRAQCVPNAKLELRSLQRQWQIEFLQFAAEVGLQLTDDFGKRRL